MIREDRPITALFSDLTEETTALLRNEVELAKVEISDKVSQAQRGMAALAIGGIVLFAGLLVLLDAAVVALAQLLNLQNLWVAPLIVGLVVAIIGAILLQRGRTNLQAEHLAPRRTAESLRRDQQFVREQMR